MEARVVVGPDLHKKTRENVDEGFKAGLFKGLSGRRESRFPVDAWVEPFPGLREGRESVAALSLGGRGCGRLVCKNATWSCRGGGAFH